MMFVLLLIVFYSQKIQVPLPDLEVAKDGYCRLLTDLPTLDIQGKPPVPVKAYTVRVKNFGGLSVSPLLVDTIYLSSRLGPSEKQEVLSKIPGRIEKVIDSTFYKYLYFYPENYYRASTVEGRDGWTTVEVMLFPFRYNPEKALLEYVKEFTIDVQGSQEKVEVRWPLYLVVAPSTFYGCLYPLLKWRAQKGYVVQFKSLEEIEREFSGIDLAEKIRNYLKEFSDYDGTKFLLLVGHENLIPLRYLYAFDCMAGIHPDENNIPSDLYYADLDGSYDANGNGVFGEIEDSVELYPDFFVGRIPAGDTSVLARYVSKVLEYEKISGSYEDYLNKYAFIAQILWSDPYTDEAIHKNRIEKRFLPEYVRVDKFYESNGTATRTAILGSLDQGRHFVNHDGHGWHNGMWFTRSSYIGIPDVQLLQNVGMYSVIYSIGCWVGALDYNSIAEEFINAENGAVGVIANSRYGWGSPGNAGLGYSDLYDSEFFRLLFENNDAELGEVFWQHKAAFVPFARDSNVYRWIYFELNLLGDPALYLWRDAPAKMEIVSEFENSEGFYEVVVSENSVPLRGVFGTICCGDSIQLRSISESDGRLTFDMSTMVQDSALLTLWKPGFLPLQKWIFTRQPLSYRLSITDTVGNQRDYVIYGRQNLLNLYIKNESAVPFRDTLFFESGGGIEITPSKVFANLHGGDSLLVPLNVFVPEGMKKNGVERLLILSSHYKINLPLKVAWPSIKVRSFRWISGSSIEVILENNSLMPVKGRALGAFGYSPSSIFPVRPDSFLIAPGGECYVSVKGIPTNTSRVSLYADLGEITFFSDLKLERDSILFEDNFETGLNWYGAREYFDLKNEGGVENNYLTLNEQYLPFALNASLVSPRFVVRGPLLIRFWFKYRFPIYGSTGVMFSIQEWDCTAGGSCTFLAEDTITFIGSGGALEGKSIYGDWASYEYRVNINKNADSASLRLRFIKEEIHNDVFWALDRLEVLDASTIELVRHEERDFGDLGIVYYTQIVKQSNITLFLISREERTLMVRIFDVSGREVTAVSFNLIKGLNEVSIPFQGQKSGVYFVKILNETKKVVFIR